MRLWSWWYKMLLGVSVVCELVSALFDDWLIQHVFQPIVDGLTWWRSHYGVAHFLMVGAVAALLAGAGGRVVHTFGRPWNEWVLVGVVVPASGVLGLAWAQRALDYARKEEREARGRFELPSARGGRTRVVHIALALAFWAILACPPQRAADLLFCVAWTLCTFALYFAACSRGRRQSRENDFPRLRGWN